MRCQWCESEKTSIGSSTVYWELPDGTRAIEIRETPTVLCQDCQIAHQSDSIVKEIETQLLLIDTKKLTNSISYAKLMKTPRLLKRNYFDYFS
ncbi:YokU family protein [Niallia sp. Krafla_26]|uniref:YokU family protein n=1 Tax=Niallia sp. Krafla_26 TaxID=3064703 RepID=UPI003D184616